MATAGVKGLKLLLFQHHEVSPQNLRWCFWPMFIIRSLLNSTVTLLQNLCKFPTIPYIRYVATLPCGTWMCRFPLTRMGVSKLRWTDPILIDPLLKINDVMSFKYFCFSSYRLSFAWDLWWVRYYYLLLLLNKRMIIVTWDSYSRCEGTVQI